MFLSIAEKQQCCKLKANAYALERHAETKSRRWRNGGATMCAVCTFTQDAT